MISDATALSDAIRAGRQSAAGAMDASLAYAELWRGIGAASDCRPALGRQAAAAFDALPPADARRSAPFGGVPTLAKDLGGPFRGLPVRAGSRLFGGEAEAEDSDLAIRFRAAGLVAFGLTTSPEFGLSLASEPAAGPVCRNPLEPDLSPGGSSGGAAAAVAAGIVAIAHATDAGGSIRVPAAACGLVGLKPGRGSIPAGPGFGNHLGGIASELAVCRSVRDCAAILAACAGDARGPFPPVAPAPEPGGPLRIGFLPDTGADHPTAPERAQAVEAAGRSLEAQGHHLVPLDWPALAPMAAASDRVFLAIVAVNLAELAASLGLDLGAAEPLTQAVAARGQALSGTELWAALTAGVLVSRDLWRLFDGFDLLLAPMLNTAPRRLGWLPTDHRDVERHFAAMAGFAPLATLANVSGFPALTLPYGADAAGLPLPLQLIAPVGAEALLLAIAARLEAEGRWQHRHPLAGFDA